MRWNHLPLAGGIYAQDPDFIDALYVFFELKNKKEAADQKKREKEMEEAKKKGNKH